MVKRKAIQWERKEQQWLVQWFKLKYPDILIAASGNGGSRPLNEAANMKREGVLAGIPDLQIFKACKNYHGLFIEMKDPGSPTRMKGKLGTVQKSIINKLNSENYYAKPAWGWIEAKEIIDWYLGGEK